MLCGSNQRVCSKHRFVCMNLTAAVCSCACATNACTSGQRVASNSRGGSRRHRLMSPCELLSGVETWHKSMSVTSGVPRKGLFSQGQLRQGQRRFQIWVLLMSVLSNSWDRDRRKEATSCFCCLIYSMAKWLDAFKSSVSVCYLRGAARNQRETTAKNTSVKTRKWSCVDSALWRFCST